MENKEKTEEIEETEEARTDNKARIFVFDGDFAIFGSIKPEVLYLREKARKEGIDLIFIQNRQLYDLYLKNKHIRDNSIRYALILGDIDKIGASQAMIKDDFNYLAAPIINLEYDSNSEKYLLSLKRELLDNGVLVSAESDIEVFSDHSKAPPSLEGLIKDLELPPEQN